MRDIMLRFMNGDPSRYNTLLLDMPPGSGKTYWSTRSIAEALANGYPGRIIFITPLKKNLPGDSTDEHGTIVEGELHKAFREAGIGKKYDEWVLVLGPVVEDSLKGGTELTRDDLRNMQTFLGDGDLSKEIEARFRQARGLMPEKASSDQFKLLVDAFEDAEGRLRRRIHAELNKRSSDGAERLRLIREEHPWILKLYPAAAASEKKVLLMSSSKFVHPFDQIVEPTTAFYESDLLKGSVVLMDEFDSIKMDWLRNLVDMDGRQRIDLVDLFRSIRGCLHNRDNHVREIYRDANDSESTRLMDFAADVEKAFDETCRDHGLEYSFKLEEEGSGGFLFRDYGTVTVGKTYHVIRDEEAKVNRISTAESGKDMSGLLRDVTRRLRYFESLVGVLAANYCRNREADGHVVQYEQAVRTVLETLGLGKGEPADYIVNAVIFHRWANNQSDPSDVTVYSRGFCYYYFEDNENHGLNSRIYQTSYYRSPESILLKVLGNKGTKVIGMSATATLRTCVRNFDLNYLSYQSVYRPYPITAEERAILDDAFDKATEHYDRVRIEVIPVKGDPDEELFDCPDVVDVISENLLNKDTAYSASRYARFAVAYKGFVANDDIRSMLCFMTLFPKSNDEFSEDRLKRICGRIRRRYGMEGSDEPFIVLRTEDFENTRRTISRKLSAGEKVFVLTTYQTVGAGQNLQYPVPDDAVTVTINDFGESDLKDFDAVYLDKPTNILPTNYGGGDLTQLATYLFYLESLEVNLEISREEQMRNIRRAFEYHAGVSTMCPKGMLDTESVCKGAVRDVIQAIGRLCRTNRKCPHILIMADRRIGDIIASPISDYGDRVNREFSALHSEMYSYREARARNDDTDPVSDRTGYVINQLVNFGDSWTPEKMGFWRDLRETVLRHPTSREGEGGNVVFSLYCRLDKPSDRLPYRVEGGSEGKSGYRRVYISGDGLDMEVSAEAAGLDRILSIPPVRSRFIEMGYATTFEPNDRIMCPVLYNNVYKGALGEATGRIILEDWDIRLHEIDDPRIFERFDFVSDNGTYVDFKHWQGMPEEANGLDWVFEKLSGIGGTQTMIINILKPDIDVRREPERHTRDGMIVWTVPYLYDDEVMNTDAYRIIREVLG